MTSIQAGPHYEIPSSELATWIERRGEDIWWSVDGDPLLTGRMPFPAPADELAAELRKLNRPLLVQANRDDAATKGELISADNIDELAAQLGGTYFPSGMASRRAQDRFLYLCWKGSPHEWLLLEDSETTEDYRAEAASQAK